MLLAEDDYPLHQTALPLAHVMDGHPNAYDRFWFNGYDEEFYFAVALGLYPNRGVVDGAFSVVQGERQYSVFASEALAGRATTVGPIRIEIVEPMRVNRVVVDAIDQGLRCDLTYTRTTAISEEPRQTMHDGARLFMDVTRATQLGTWSGWIETPNGHHQLPEGFLGTKDRSWGVRPIGEPLPGVESHRAPQLAFFWAPLHFGEGGLHFMTFDDAHGHPLSRSAVLLPSEGAAEMTRGQLKVEMQRGTRWMRTASLHLDEREISLTPVLRFQMRGAGYSHPQFAHGRWHGGPIVSGEQLNLESLDPLDFANIHVQHVVRATCGEETGLGVLEQLVIGPYEPSGLRGLLDGAQ
ncbi:MAG TPA: hypothetical protein VIH73_07655 [Acidimicrobiales bacterium]